MGGGSPEPREGLVWREEDLGGVRMGRRRGEREKRRGAGGGEWEGDPSPGKRKGRIQAGDGGWVKKG